MRKFLVVVVAILVLATAVVTVQASNGESSKPCFKLTWLETLDIEPACNWLPWCTYATMLTYQGGDYYGYIRVGRDVRAHDTITVTATLCRPDLSLSGKGKRK